MSIQLNRFDEKIKAVLPSFRKQSIDILQVNLGKLCNLTCSHCHVEAGPTKTAENMNKQTVEAVCRFLEHSNVTTLDLTGGAPEMNPYFRELVLFARNRGVGVIDRCNLTVLYTEGQEDLANFLAAHEVQIVASLPCYSSENVDKQRGRGTFDDSIRALKDLNALGYGRDESSLELDLVYNPVGAHLPPSQEKLESDYKERLQKDFGIVFNRLFTITNMPITRYANYLKALNQYEDYVELLINSFNPATVNGLMCLNTLNVNWDGSLYDCDFNNVLGMKMSGLLTRNICDVTPEEIRGFEIQTGEHCFGCTAGAGSSCQGALE